MEPAQLEQCLRKHYESFHNCEFSLAELEQRHGIKLTVIDEQKEAKQRRADAPKKLRIIKLYDTIGRTPTVYANEFNLSIALGLARAESDVKTGRVNNWWTIPDKPEDNLAGGTNVIDTNDVTCFAKMHLIPGNSDSINIEIRPIQKTALNARNHSTRLGVNEELKAKLAQAGGKTRLISRRIKRFKEDKDIFEHNERHMAMALVCLEMAKRLKDNGIKIGKLIMPSKAQVEEWQKKGGNKDKTTVRQYEEIEKVLKAGAENMGVEFYRRQYI